MDETFLLTNIAPQVGEGFNRHCKLWTRLFIYLHQANRIVTYRLGICRRFLPKTDDSFLGCVCIYRPTVLAKKGTGRQMESCERSYFLRLDQRKCLINRIPRPTKSLALKRAEHRLFLCPLISRRSTSFRDISNDH